MKRIGYACCLLLSIHVARAQVLTSTDLRILSDRWAAYYATVYRVPIELVEAIIDEESAWNPYAISSKGAVGMMQLMPETAARFGVRNRYRLDENIRGGVAYLAWLIRLFKGDFRLAIAAYYVGERPILRRQLDYSSIDVHEYVSRVARRFRARCRQKVTVDLIAKADESRGEP
ncbi:MAG TPA: lytic transglycosylase domain-containing protein [Terriglobales bacterium]|nr:lytic transglycosylase domain-containing protein [Terriglobales bacterium]